MGMEKNSAKYLPILPIFDHPMPILADTPLKIFKTARMVMGMNGAVPTIGFSTGYMSLLE